jgi:hypothetical protein
LEPFRPNSAKLFAVLSSLDSAPKKSPEIFGALRGIAIRVRLAVRELFANGFLSPPQSGHRSGFFSFFIFLLLLEILLLNRVTHRLQAANRSMAAVDRQRPWPQLD